MITSGMNVVEVRQLAQSLQQGAERLRGVVSIVDGRVNHSSWVGPQADRFRYEFWPAHRSQVLQAAEALHGLAQSANNNADEQERAAGVAGDGAWQAGGGPGAGWAAGAAVGGAAATVAQTAGRFLRGLDDLYRPFGAALGLIDVADWPVLRNPDLPASRLMSDLAGDARLKFIGGALGAISVGAGAYETYQSFSSGDYYEGTLDAVDTAAGAAKSYIPGPAGYLAGVAGEVWADNFRVGREIDWDLTGDSYAQYMNPFVAENWTKTILPGARDGLVDGFTMTLGNLLP